MCAVAASQRRPAKNETDKWTPEKRPQQHEHAARVRVSLRDPLAAAAEMAAAGVDAVVVSELSDTNPVTEIRFRVPFDVISDAAGITYLQDVYGPGISEPLNDVGLGVTVWVDAASLIVRFDPNQMRADTLHALGIDIGEEPDDSVSSAVLLSFDVFDEAVDDVQAPPPDQMVTQEDFDRLMSEYIQRREEPRA